MWCGVTWCGVVAATTDSILCVGGGANVCVCGVYQHWYFAHTGTGSRATSMLSSSA